MSINNLTGTTWRFNSNISGYGAEYNINFTSNSNSYIKLELEEWDELYGDSYLEIHYDSTTVFNSSGWVNSNYKTITITGGEDVTNSSLISFLQNNATLVEDYYLVSKSELTEVADAIREKGNTSASLVYPTGFVSAINNINTDNGGISIENIGAFVIRVTATPYPFLLGMTWQQFLDSDFSTAGFRIKNNSVQYFVHPNWKNVGDPVCQPTDIISNGVSYNTFAASSSYNITVLIDSPYNNDTAFAEPSTFTPNDTDIVLTALPGDGSFDHWEMPSDVQWNIISGGIDDEQCVINILDESDATITAVFTDDAFFI